MSAENKALVERWFEEVWNKGRADAVDEMFAAEGIARGLGQDLHGPAEFKVFHSTFREAFPDVRVQVDEMIAEGDKVAYRLTATCTHRGNGLGFAPTGRPACFGVMGSVRIANGRITEGWNLLDQFGMLTQLGVVALPGN
jgi:predicted ester cyclase